MTHIRIVPSILLAALSLAAVTANSAEYRGPGYWCREDEHERRYQQKLRSLNRTIRLGGPGQGYVSDASAEIRDAARRFEEIWLRERNRMTAAVRSCRAGDHAAAKAAVMAALRKADAEAKAQVERGNAGVREAGRKYIQYFRELGDNWLAFVRRCTSHNSIKVGSGSAGEWTAYGARMQTRVTIMRRKAQEAVKAASGYRETLDLRYRNTIRRLNERVLGLPSYPAACTVSARPVLSGWIGKWMTSRGEVCVKGRVGGLTVTPVDGGFLQRRQGKVEVAGASASRVTGRWSVPRPKLNGNFEWRLAPSGLSFEGRFSKTPGGPLTKPWNGKRVGEC